MVNFIAKFLPEKMRPYAGRIVWTVAGLLVAVFFLTIGFWRTLLVLLLCGAGFVVGLWRDGKLDPDRMPWNRGQKP